MKHGVDELRSHWAAFHLRVPQVDRAGQRDGGRGTECGGGSHDCADVAGILDGVENEHPAPRADLKCVQLPPWYRGDSYHPLRRFGLGGAAEVFFRYLQHFDPGCFEAGAQRLTTRRIAKLGRDESTLDCESRA